MNININNIIMHTLKNTIIKTDTHVKKGLSTYSNCGLWILYIMFIITPVILLFMLLFIKYK